MDEEDTAAKITFKIPKEGVKPRIFVRSEL